MNALLKLMFLSANVYLVSREGAHSCCSKERVNTAEVAQKHFARWVHPGQCLSEDGKAAFIINQASVGPLDDKMYMIDKFALGQLAPQCEKMYEQSQSLDFDQLKKTDSNGLSCLQGGIEVSVGQNPTVKRNYNKAFEDFSNQLQERFWELSEEGMLSEIKAIHGSLFANVEDVALAGEFRDSGIVIILDNKHTIEETLDEKLPMLPVKEATKIRKILSNTARLLNLSAEDRKLLEKIFVVAPDWQEVEALMKEFVVELKAKKEQGVDVIELAAFAHQKMAHIHPFADGNGRAARIMMNAILTQDGCNPVIFKSDEEYTKEVAKGAGPEGVRSFTKYLQKVLNSPI